jgi:MSHA biogenesis protein MshQ
MGMLLFLQLHNAIASDFSEFDNAFTSPVQTWNNAENGTLALGGNTHIYGFDEVDKDFDDKVKIKLKAIIDNETWKTFCHIGFVEDSPQGYICKVDSFNNILDINTIPEFDVNFDDVDNISISNSSNLNETFNYVSGELDLPPGDYNKITISTENAMVYFKPGKFKIKTLSLTNGTNLIFPKNSEFEIDELSASPWEGKRITFESNSEYFVVKKLNLSLSDFSINRGEAKLGDVTMSASSLNVYDAAFLASSLSVMNGSDVRFNESRNRTNFKIKKYTMSGGSSRAYFFSGDYYIKYFYNGSSDNVVESEGDVNFISNVISLSGAGKGKGRKTNFYALDDKNTGDNASFSVTGSANLCANAFSRRTFTVSGNGLFTGSVIADKTVLSGSGSLRYYPGAACSANEINSDTYRLQLQPAEAYSLICAAQRLEFQVVDSNNQATGDFTGTISVSPASASLALIQGKGSGSKGSYTPNANGELWLDLTASASQTVTITGTLNPQGDSDSVSGTYHFVPYKLAAGDQYVIANKPQTIELKALACNDNGGVVDINYAGTPTIQSDWVAPTSGAGDLTFAPAFIQGAASSELTMEDSGIQTVTMTDKDFDCSGLTDCPVEGSGTLQGSFTVYSRPWTLAICSPNGNTMDGDITNPDSLAFTKAGNLFALNIRPLRWVSSSGDDSSPQVGGSAIETSAYCSSAVTQNFFSDNSQLAALAVLSHQVAQPADGNDGTLDGTLEQLNTTGINSTYLPFPGVSWSEVGVLRVNADISGSYLGMTVNQGYRDIGRFYPAWLSITENSWDYADDHNGFVYMNQTIPYRFTVEAQNMQSDATTNYSAFSQALIADVKLLAVDGDGEELSDRIDEYDLQLWDGSGDGAWSGATLSVSNDFTFLKQQQSASPYTTSVDGPYQSGFGLRVSDKVDGVDFVSPDLELKASTTLLDTGKRFTTQPDIRYGRMVLGDVGGTSVSTINVPLRVEYWQGSRFAINADDSGSYFATPNEYVCKQTVWPTSGSGSSSKLTGSDTPSSWAKVASGKSSVVFATPASSDETADVREQVRFWLRLDDDARSSPQLSESGVNCGAQYTSQPWLQYNWRDKGDEDPSAVVTFGIHRGNDKVIFRGETRLTGQ